MRFNWWWYIFKLHKLLLNVAILQNQCENKIARQFSSWLGEIVALLVERRYNTAHVVYLINIQLVVITLKDVWVTALTVTGNGTAQHCLGGASASGALLTRGIRHTSAWVHQSQQLDKLDVDHDEFYSIQVVAWFCRLSKIKRSQISRNFSNTLWSFNNCLNIQMWC